MTDSNDEDAIQNRKNIAVDEPGGPPPPEDQPVGDAPGESPAAAGDADGSAGGGEKHSKGKKKKKEADPLEQLEAEVDKWRDLALRSQADLDNYRKRMAREKADAIEYANAALLETLLPVLDNFYLGLEASRDEKSSAIYQGMAMVLKQIEDFLRDAGVEEIASENGVFDPNLHEAVAHEYSDDVAEGSIISEVRKGYKLKDRLIRPSNIIVSKGPQPPASAAESS